MATKGIIFSAPMVRALLDGRKTQTRRLLTLPGFREFSEFGPSDTPGYDWHFRRKDGCWCDFRATNLPLPYAPGDRLYVREACRAVEDDEGWDHVEFLADDTRRRIGDHPANGVKWLELFHHGQKPGASPPACVGRSVPSIHMPRWASRLWLSVTDVRVQRLQEISEDDAVAEGIERRTGVECADGVARDMWFGVPHVGYAIQEGAARQAYFDLWDSLHNPRGLCADDEPNGVEANPWIVAVSFTVHHGNINSSPPEGPADLTSRRVSS